MEKINIAIDGLAGAGKSTVAKLVAKKLNYTYIDTGAMYRSIAYLADKRNISTKSCEKLLDLIKNDFDFKFIEGKVLLNLEDVTQKIRTPKIDKLVSDVVAFQNLRKEVVKIQRNIAKDQGVVMDGRDIGNVVLKDAKLKIFLVASIEARAKRRYEEFLKNKIEYSYEDIVENIENRDYIDINVSKALKKSDDALLIDSSFLSVTKVVNKIISLAFERMN